MSSNIGLFPGVYTEVHDRSISIRELPAALAFICFMSQKGPDNSFRLLNKDDLYNMYGETSIKKYGQGMKVASGWLEYSDGLYGIRVLPDETNLPCQNTIYEKIYGEYISDRVDMKEAAYANLAISVNESGLLEFVQYGPVDLGFVKSLNPTAVPTTPKLADRYYVTDTLSTTGTAATNPWFGMGGHIAICVNDAPVVWTFEYIESSSTALTVGGQKKVAAVKEKSVTLPAVAPIYTTGTAPAGATPISICLPAGPTYNNPIGWSKTVNTFYIAGKHEKGFFAGHENEIATYDSLGKWTYIPDTAATTIKLEIVNEIKKESEASGEGIYLISPASSAKLFVDNKSELYVVLPKESNVEEETSVIGCAFGTLATIYMSDGATKNFTYTNLAGASDGTKVIVTRSVTWVDDVDADFLSYVNSVPEINTIMSQSRPDLAITRGTIEPLFFFYPTGRGTWYNNLKLSIKAAPSTIHVTNDKDKTLIFEIIKFDDGNKIIMESYEVSFNPNKKDLNGESMFIKDVLEKYSELLRCETVIENLLDDTYSYMLTINKDIDNLFTSWETLHIKSTVERNPSLNYGSDGNIYDSDGNINWEVATALLCRAYTGMIKNPAKEDPNNMFETEVFDTEVSLFSYVLDAGYPKSVKTAINSLIIIRSYDSRGIIDMGDNVTAARAFKERTDGIGKGFNTPYMTIYEPYSLIYDADMGRDTWITPTYFAAKSIALTNRDYGCHHAAAGPKRGNCLEVKKLRYNLYKEPAYKDMFVSYCINPIIETKDGYYIWGQSTSQLAVSKLQDANVVDLINQIKRTLKLNLRSFLFDLNNPYTWNLIESAVNAYLGSKVSEGALEDYSAYVYATDYDKTLHRCRVDIELTPVQAIYQIIVSITV